MKDLANLYKNIIIDILNKISGETEMIQKAAKVVAESIAREELIHVIAPGGHSNIAAEEVFWRAGGLAPINAILDAGFNLIHGAKRSNVIERTPGYAIKVLDAYRLGKKPGEVIIIANAYGVSPMCIDLVLEAKRRKMITIGITSRSFADTVPKDMPSRHPNGKNLYQEVDYFINCHLPYGDAILEVEGCQQKVGPTATICNVFAINLLMAETVKELVKVGIEPPIWMSVNLPGGDEKNRKIFDKYIPLIKHLG